MNADVQTFDKCYFPTIRYSRQRFPFLNVSPG